MVGLERMAKVANTCRVNVLSIDVDFFVEPVAFSMPFGAVERLDANQYVTDPTDIVESVLDRCGLSKSDPVPGVFVRHHHQAFDILSMLCGAEKIASLTHVDAHSDLGMGDSAFVYIATELAHLPVSARRNPRRSDTGLNEANWLAFAVAAGWVDHIIFVPRVMPTLMHHDLHPWHLNALRDQVVIRKATQAEQKSISYGARALLEKLPVAEAAAFEVHDAATFRASRRPDFAIICQSPQFTPATAGARTMPCASHPRFVPNQS